MTIQTGKQYRMRYGGVTGVVTGVNLEHQYPFTDGRYRFAADGKFIVGCERHDMDLIAEVEVRDKLPFELRAGGKYVLDNGDVVTLGESGFSVHEVHRFLPFLAGGVKYGYVTCDGEVLKSYAAETACRITAEYIEPKPPTPIERLEKAIQLFANPRTDDEAFALVRGVIADLKAEAAK